MHDDGMTENLVPDPTGRVLVPGSTRPPIAGEHAAPAADLQIDITVVVRRRAPLPDPLPGPLTPAELAREYGATPEDMTVLTATIEAAGATVVASDPGSRRVRVRGSVTDLEALFGTSLRLARVRDPASGDLRTVRTRQGELSVPAALGEIVTAVLGLDTRPQGRMRFRIAPAAAVSVSYTPVQLAEIYRFPSGTDGSGQTVAIIELGGGFAQPDLDDYFAGLGLATPSVQAVGVDGAQNEPGQDPNGADGEVLLDIDVVGGMAPKADIVVYFGPNTDAGFLDAVSTAAARHPDARRHQHQLGPGRGRVDRAGPHGHGRGVRRRRGAGGGGHGRGRRRWQHRPDHRRQGPLRLPGVQPPRTGLWRHQPARRRQYRGDHLGSGLEQRGPARVRPAAGSATRLRCRITSPPSECPLRRPVAPAAASPTWPLSPTPAPAIRSGSMASPRSTAAPARSLRCGRP